MRICLAEIAMNRGETKNARAVLDAADASGKVLRVRQARLLGAAVAAKSGRAAELATLERDFPELRSSEEFRDMLDAATRADDPTVRRTALELLAVSDKKRAAKRAADMRNDADAAVRARAVELSGAK
jgi:hypothetical protein